MGLSPKPVQAAASHGPRRGAAPPTTLRFARVARALADEARRLGLRAPGFRSPPGLAETDRTIRRAERGAVVSVRLRDRPFEAAVADMVDGVVAANPLESDAALTARVLLTRAAVLELDADPDGAVTASCSTASRWVVHGFAAKKDGGDGRDGRDGGARGARGGAPAESASEHRHVA